MNQKSLLPKLIAITLTFSLFLQIMFVGVYAVASNQVESTAKNTEKYDYSDDTYSTDIIEEIIEERTENTKHFRLKNGLRMAAVYSSAIHYDEDGKWVDIDNTPVDNNSDGEQELQNKNSDMSVSFSKKSNGKKLVRVEKKGYKLSWNIIGSNKTTITTTIPETTKSPSVLTKTELRTVYKNILKKTDIEYILSGKELKENIILKSTEAPHEISVEYKSAGLTASLDEYKKTLFFKNDAKETIYVFHAPFMQDSAGAFSTSLHYEIIEQKKNSVTVKLVGDLQWLRESSRLYPVVIDPVMVKYADATDDTFVSSAEPNTTHHEVGSLYVGVISGYGITASYLKINELPTLGVGCKIVDAQLGLQLKKSDGGDMFIDLRRVNSEWSENSLTYNNQPSCDDTVIDYRYIPSYEADVYTTELFTITELVRRWYDSPNENFGIKLSTEKTSACKAWFLSSDYNSIYVGSGRHPFLIISYRNMSGYEDYYSYTSVAAGRCGTASVNNFNGNLIYTQPLLLGAAGNKMPISLQLIYNSNKRSMPHSIIGKGWQLNYHLYIAPNPDLSTEATDFEKKYRYIFNDSDGTIHYFWFENGENSSRGVDEDGLGYTLDVIESVSQNSSLTDIRYILTDKNNNTTHFNSYGYLLSITNKNNISINVIYEKVSGVVRMKKITDGAGNQYNFDYLETTPARMCGISFKNEQINFSVSGNLSIGKLNRVTFCDSKTITFEYFPGVLLERVSGINGECTRFTYHSKVGKPIQWLIMHGEPSEGQTNGSIYYADYFYYYQNRTLLTKNTHRPLEEHMNYELQFDNYGHVTSILSLDDGTALGYSYNNGNSPSNKAANKILTNSAVQQSVTNFVRNPSFDRALTGWYDTYIADSSEGGSVVHDSSVGHFANGSAKITKKSGKTKTVFLVQNMSWLPAGTYTISAYIKGTNCEQNGEYPYLKAEIWNRSGNKIDTFSTNPTKLCNGDTWKRMSITISVTSEQYFKMVAGFADGQNSGTLWIDDIQIEQGYGTSSFNLIENSAFDRGFEQWAKMGTTVEISPNSPRLFSHSIKLANTSVEGRTRAAYRIKISGKKNDVFSAGGWASMTAVPETAKYNDNVTSVDKQKYPAQYFYVEFVNNNTYKGITIKLNPYISSWQFASSRIIAPMDYQQINFFMLYDYTRNTAYATGMYLFKEEYGETYRYDSAGNLVDINTVDSNSTKYSYTSNTISSVKLPDGTNSINTVDANTKLLKTVRTPSGQRLDHTYDNNGNVLSSTLGSENFAFSTPNNGVFYIINAETGLALTNDSGTIKDKTWDGSIHQKWKLAKSDSFYTICSQSEPQKYVSFPSSGNQMCFANGITDARQKFSINKQSGAFFQIAGDTKAIDGKEGASANTGKTTACALINSGKKSQQWLFVTPKVDLTTSQYIRESATYSDNGNYLSTISDSLGNTTEYGYYEDIGELSYISDPMGNYVSYTYDSMHRMTSAEQNTDVTYYRYQKDRLSQILVQGSSKYQFSYNSIGQKEDIKASYSYYRGNDAPYTIAHFDYDAKQRISAISYGESNSVSYTYDEFDRITRKKYNDNDLFSANYYYGNDGRLAYMQDMFTGTHTKYIYDTIGRIVEEREFYGTNLSEHSPKTYSVNEYSPNNGKVSAIAYKTPISNDERKIEFTFGDPNKINQIGTAVYSAKNNGITQFTREYDALGRLKKTDYSLGNKTITAETTYLNGNKNATSSLVSKYTVFGYEFSYNYDANGRIILENDGEYNRSYEYDSCGRITRVNDARECATYIYSYAQGNIISMTEYAYTTREPGTPLSSKSWNYDLDRWDELLTSCGDRTFEYDTNGTPIMYNGHALTWNNEHRMTSYSNQTDTNTYVYNASGNRISKKVNDITTLYFYVGDVLVGQQKDNEKIEFLFDENSDVYGFTLNGKKYLYGKNLQGDISLIFEDNNDHAIVEYYYDIWGKPLRIVDRSSNNIGTINPLRYRSYYYDTETGFYYISSRYYDPEICRFINADDIDYLGADGNSINHNLFAYCLNDPVNRFDVNGNWSMPNWAKVTIGAVAIAGLAAATICTGGTVAVICGAALSGAIAGGTSGAVIGCIGGGISGGWQGALDGVCSGFMSGTLIGGITGAASAGLNIATGTTAVIGNAHGSNLHKLATNLEAGKMTASGRYFQIGINKSLKKMGLNGGLSRPDIVGIGKNGVNKLVEVISPRQSANYIVNKMSTMLSDNPRTIGKIIYWVRRLFK